MQEGLWTLPERSLARARLHGDAGVGEVAAEALRLLTFPPWPRRQKILKEKAVPMIEGYMFEEHEMIRRAATECMCNLAMSKEVRAGPGGPDRQARSGTSALTGFAAAHSAPPPLLWPQVQDLFEATGNDRLKLLVLYSGEDDELLRRAAAGGLAMLTSMRPSLCSRIPQVVSASSRLGEGGSGRERPTWRTQQGTRECSCHV